MSLYKKCLSTKTDSAGRNIAESTKRSFLELHVMIKALPLRRLSPVIVRLFLRKAVGAVSATEYEMGHGFRILTTPSSEKWLTPSWPLA
jgi:hypothetical protein